MEHACGLPSEPGDEAGVTRRWHGRPFGSGSTGVSTAEAVPTRPPRSPRDRALEDGGRLGVGGAEGASGDVEHRSEQGLGAEPVEVADGAGRELQRQGPVPQAGGHENGLGQLTPVLVVEAGSEFDALAQ